MHHFKKCSRGGGGCPRTPLAKRMASPNQNLKINNSCPPPPLPNPGYAPDDCLDEH